MKGTIAFIHLLAVGCWLGCYLTEAVFEYLGLRDREQLIFATILHDRVDRYVEIPVFLVVLLSGTWLLQDAVITPTLLVKTGFAFIAIALNIACAFAVRRRHRALERGDLLEVASASVFIRLTFLGLIPGLVPLVLGMQIYLAHAT